MYIRTAYHTIIMMHAYAGPYDISIDYIDDG